MCGVGVRVVGELDERIDKMPGWRRVEGVPGGALGVKNLRRVVGLKTLRELLGHIMFSERYQFIPRLRTKSQIGKKMVKRKTK